jgi:hypothetical protein
MRTTPDTKIQAARKAFHAYERAVAAAREVMADGPVRGLGTTILEAQYPEGMHRSDPTGFKCVECEVVHPGAVDVLGWKFCPGCGAEIMRFAREPEREPEKVEFVDQHGHRFGSVKVSKPKEKYVTVAITHLTDSRSSEKRLRGQKGRAAGK